MPELVYPPVVALARTAFRVLDLRITVDGAEHVPATGGAVLASNHIGYLDFIFAGCGVLPAKRYVRWMAKQEVFAHRIGGPLMRAMRAVPERRDAFTEERAIPELDLPLPSSGVLRWRAPDRLEKHMSAPLPTIGAGEAIETAMSALAAADAALVLVDGKPAGVVTRSDVLAFLSG